MHSAAHQKEEESIVQIITGHYTSEELVHWQHLPVALTPEPGVDQNGCWSGTAIVNRGVPTIIYTGGHGDKATICVATGDDEMVRWRKYLGNPVIPAPPRDLPVKEFRDPYVWQEGDTFYLIVGSGIADVGGAALLYKSPDLIHWEYVHPLRVGDKRNSGVFWEMPVFGRIGNKHVLIVTEVPARDSYWIGTWENERFTPDSATPSRLEVVNHYLSPSIRHDPKGRLVAIGIIPETRSPVEGYAAGWAHLYGLPRVLSLFPDGRLRQQPLPGLAMLRDKHIQHQDLVIRERQFGAWPEVRGDMLEIIAEFEPVDAKRFGLRLRRSPDGQEETRLYYDVPGKSITVDRTHSSLDPAVQKDPQSGPFELSVGETLKLHLFVDRSVLEVFANERGTIATRVYPVRPDSLGVDVFSEGGSVRLKALDVWTMKSIWA